MAKDRPSLSTGYRPEGSAPAGVKGLPKEGREFISGGTQAVASKDSDQLSFQMRRGLLKWIRGAVAVRKDNKNPVRSQVGIIQLAVHEFMQKHHPDLRPEDWPEVWDGIQ